jgi:MoxR-like ATPase
MRTDADQNLRQDVSFIKDLAYSIKSNVEQVIVGKGDIIDLTLTALIAQGHVLLDDVPGTGKTKLARSVSRSIDAAFSRVQFTADLLPSDLTGIHFYNQKEGEFVFRPGPLFSNILLADEINRATARTQSSLLECMEERQITVDGETMILDRPFLVIATQNPVETQGTFPLPEAQLDRFMIRISLGYPDTDDSRRILDRFRTGDPLTTLEPVCSKADLIRAQNLYMQVHVRDEVLTYILRIVQATRTDEAILLGVSPRGALALMKAAQVYAAIQGREFVTPDDVKKLMIPVLSHRIILQSSSSYSIRSSWSGGTSRAAEVLKRIAAAIPCPTEQFTEE